MKLCICKPADALPDYLNVTDERVTDPKPGCHYVEVLNVGDLSALVDAGEVDELVVTDLGKFKDTASLLDHWVSRVAVGGFIGVGSYDLIQVAAWLVEHPDHYRYVAGEVHAGRFDSYALHELVEALSSRGIKITARRLDNLVCWAAGVRQ